MIELPSNAILVGRVWRAGIGPCIVTVRNGRVIDITTKEAPTMSDLLENADIAGFVAGLEGDDIGSAEEIAAASIEPRADVTRLLAPCDLQAIKACGVTFARSMIERVIEERAGGDPTNAAGIRERIADVIGDSLRDLVPGSPEAEKVKTVLQAEGLWSQYLEVGIGPDAEVFSKAQPMSAVGWGASVGLHPISKWNNPEPEVVLAVNSKGGIVGATLGNDVNLRDVEGRSALLLGKAKDNNAAASLGPFIRIFDAGFTYETLLTMKLTLTVTGEDGFTLTGESSMSQISRKPADLVNQTCGRHHQYPDGFMLYCGTMFSPVQDRDGPGQGFTHHMGDIVTIATPELGALVNTVRLSTEAPEWVFGTRALMANLSGRGLI